MVWEVSINDSVALCRLTPTAVIKFRAIFGLNFVTKGDMLLATLLDLAQLEIIHYTLR